MKRKDAGGGAGGADSSTERSREYEQWAKFDGPRAPPIELEARGPLKYWRTVRAQREAYLKRTLTFGKRPKERASERGRWRPRSVSGRLRPEKRGEGCLPVSERGRLRLKKKDEGCLPVSERGRLRPEKRDEGCLPVSERGRLRPENRKWALASQGGRRGCDP